LRHGLGVRLEEPDDREAEEHADRHGGQREQETTQSHVRGG
jgi:hypothetical protein